jgi:hypothetical protein
MGEDITSILLKEFAASVARVDLNVRCVHCSGPSMTELEDLLSSSQETLSTAGDSTEFFKSSCDFV